MNRQYLITKRSAFRSALCSLSSCRSIAFIFSCAYFLILLQTKGVLKMLVVELVLRLSAHVLRDVLRVDVRL